MPLRTHNKDTREPAWPSVYAMSECHSPGAISALSSCGHRGLGWSREASLSWRLCLRLERRWPSAILLLCCRSGLAAWAGPTTQALGCSSRGMSQGGASVPLMGHWLCSEQGRREVGLLLRFLCLKSEVTDLSSSLYEAASSVSGM